VRPSATILVLALLSASAGTAACGGDPHCRTAIIDQVDDAGRPSPRAALALVLADSTFHLSQSGWIAGYRSRRPNRSVTFVSGRDRVRTSRSSVNGRWYSDEVIDC